jgi:hypothetical protein
VRTFEALRKLGWKGKYLAYGHIQAEDELKRLKDDDFYVYGTNAFFTDNTEAHKKIRASSEREKTIYPYTQLTDGWIGATVIEEILKKVSWPATADKVREAMNQVKVDTKGLKGGPIIWTKENHYRTTGYYRAYKWDSKKNGIVIAKIGPHRSEMKMGSYGDRGDGETGREASPLGSRLCIPAKSCTALI